MRGIGRGGSRLGGIRGEAGFGEFGEEFIGGFELTVGGGDIDVTAGGEGGDGVGVLIDDLAEEGVVIFAEDAAETFMGDDFMEKDFADASGGDAVFKEVDGTVVPKSFCGGAFFDEFAEVFGEGCGVNEFYLYKTKPLRSELKTKGVKQKRTFSGSMQKYCETYRNLRPRKRIRASRSVAGCGGQPGT